MMASHAPRVYLSMLDHALVRGCQSPIRPYLPPRSWASVRELRNGPFSTCPKTPLPASLQVPAPEDSRLAVALGPKTCVLGPAA